MRHTTDQPREERKKPIVAACINQGFVEHLINARHCCRCQGTALNKIEKQLKKKKKPPPWTSHSGGVAHVDKEFTVYSLGSNV